MPSWLLYYSALVLCMCRGLVLGVGLCLVLVMRLRSCPDFVVVFIGLVGGGLVLLFVSFRVA